jgi:hypothetical protein
VIADRLRITEQNLALRKSLIGLGPADIRTLARLKGWAQTAVNPLIRDLLDWQLQHEGVVEFLESSPHVAAFSPSQVRERLELEQRKYFLQIFEEAAGGGKFGLDYFENRLQIGRRHNAINLPQKWYLSASAAYVWIFRRHLKQGLFFARPFFRHNAEVAFAKVMNYDAQAVADAYLLGLLDELGFDSACIPPLSATHDLTDGIKHLKIFMRQATDQMRRIHSELNDVGTVIGQVATAVTNGTQDQMLSLAAAAETLRGLQQVVHRTAEDAEKADAIASSHSSIDCGSGFDRTLSDIIAEVLRSSDQIKGITAVIDDLSMQTNLLAINAAIEASRAGEHGKGFAVIAKAVRELSVRSSQASKGIRDLAIQASRSIHAGSDATGRLAGFIQTFSESAGQQSAAISEFEHSMRQIQEAGEATSNSIHELTEMASKLSVKIADLESVFRGFKLQE